MCEAKPQGTARAPQGASVLSQARRIDKPDTRRASISPSRSADLWRRRRRREAWNRRGHRQLEVVRTEGCRGLRANLLHDVGGVALVAVGGLGDHHVTIAVAYLGRGIDVGEAAHFLEPLLIGYRQLHAAGVFRRAAPGQADSFGVGFGREVDDALRMRQLGRNWPALRSAAQRR